MSRLLAFDRRTRRLSVNSSSISLTFSRKQQSDCLDQLLNDLQVLVLEDPDELRVVASLVARKLVRLRAPAKIILGSALLLIGG